MWWCNDPQHQWKPSLNGANLRLNSNIQLDFIFNFFKLRKMFVNELNYRRCIIKPLLTIF